MPDIDITNSLKKKNISGILKSIRNLPSIPTVLIEVSRLLDNPMTNASELAETISKDQGIVAKILTVANSSLYGLPRRVSTVDFAIVILGFENIKNIVIALTTIETFSGKSDKNWNKSSYWIHSMTVAGLAKKIAEDIGFPKSGEAFTSGLLHDLGVSIIQRYMNDEFNQICELVEMNNISFFKAEQNILGATHQEIGKLLVEKWNLPKSLSDAIYYHHTPEACEENNKLAAIIHLADYMTQYFNKGTFKWDQDYELDKSVIDILNLGDEVYLEQFIDSYQNYLINS